MAKEIQKDAKAAETAENKAETVKEQASKKEQKAIGPVYTAGELAANASKIFATRPECVTAALKAAGKPECTVPEAKTIVEKFLKKGVR